MTYSIVARCGRTGQLGVAVSTSDIAVGARVPWVRTGVGAAVTQHRTDPRLGPRMLDLLARGANAAEAVAGARSSTKDSAWRQLAAIGVTGPAAAWTGQHVAPDGVSVIVREDHAVAGNILTGPHVGVAVSEAFTESMDLSLGERLVCALEAGLTAGGEPTPLRSACLIVHGVDEFPLVNLRVDEHETPVAELRRLWALYSPSAQEYVRRALAPETAQGTAPEPSEA